MSNFIQIRQTLLELLIETKFVTDERRRYYIPSDFVDEGIIMNGYEFNEASAELNRINVNFSTDEKHSLFVLYNIEEDK